MLSEPSPLLGTATVVLTPRLGDDNVGGTDNSGGDDTPTSDDAAVLQALYDGAPLSSVFHHDLAEGVRTLGLIGTLIHTQCHSCHQIRLMCSVARQIGWNQAIQLHSCDFRLTGSGVITAEQRRMEDVAKRAAQRAVNQLRMSRHTLRAGAGQVRHGVVITWREGCSHNPR